MRRREALEKEDVVLDVPEEEADRELLLAAAHDFENKDYFVAQKLRSSALCPLLVLLIAFSGIGYYFMYRPNASDWKRAPSGRGVAAPTVLISIDGFRHDFWQRRKDPSNHSSDLLAPNLYNMANRGVYALGGMQPVMPTSTWPNHWSMVTGLYPETTEIVGDTMYNPASKKWFHLSRNDSEWWSGTPIWHTLRRTPRVVFESTGKHLPIDEPHRTASIFFPGSEAREFSADVSWTFNKNISEQDRVSEVVSLLKGTSSEITRPVHFVSLYLESIEVACRRYGPDSTQINQAIEKVDKTIGALVEALGRDTATTHNIIIVSDHGMTSVPSPRTFDLSSRIKNRTAQDISVSPLGFFLNVSVSADDLYQNMQEALRDNKDGFTVYRKEQLPKRWHLRESRLVTPVVTMANKGWRLEYSHQNLVPNADKATEDPENLMGQSGFDNTMSDMQALFIAEGPAFRQRKQVKKMRTVDVYEMLCRIFAIQAQPNNGSLETTFPSILKVT